MPDTLVMERGEAAFRKNGCHGCHIIQKFGTPIGPTSPRSGASTSPSIWPAGCATRRSSARAHMPALELTEDDVQTLAAYLGSLR
jgi:mono/diheme cytochrome c family protein